MNGHHWMADPSQSRRGPPPSDPLQARSQEDGEHWWAESVQGPQLHAVLLQEPLQAGASGAHSPPQVQEGQIGRTVADRPQQVKEVRADGGEGLARWRRWQQARSPQLQHQQAASPWRFAKHLGGPTAHCSCACA